MSGICEFIVSRHNVSGTALEFVSCRELAMEYISHIPRARQFIGGNPAVENRNVFPSYRESQAFALR